MKLKQREISKADMSKKVEAYKTLNQVLVSANAEFIKSLSSILTEKETQLSQLEEKLKEGNGTEQENADYIFIGGYVQCLKDILNAKKSKE